MSDSSTNFASLNLCNTLPSNEFHHDGLGFQSENLSIMIPNYNGEEYIGETIASLLVQGDSLGRAQMMVLDNCSTDNSEEVVRQVGKGRVEFFRRQENVGALTNFKECYSRATKPWVYILHSDDYALPWFFREVDSCICKYSNAKAIFGRSLFVDEKGVWNAISPVLGDDQDGLMNYHPLMWAHNPLQYVGVVVSKSAIALVGNFQEQNPLMCDWNLWWRIARTLPVAYTSTCIGAYRQHSGSDTTRIYADGRYFDSALRQLDVMNKVLREDLKWRHVDSNALYTTIFDECLYKCLSFIDDPQAFNSNLSVLSRFPSTPKRCLSINRLKLRYGVHRLKKHLNQPRV